MIISPGIYYSMPATEYHADRAVSKSALDQFERSPAHYQHWLTNPPDPTPAMRIGTLAHMAVFETSRFRASTAVAPIVDRRTKEGKAIYEQFSRENEGKEIITADEMQRLENMRAAVFSHAAGGKLLGDGKAEVSVFVRDRDVNLDLKARVDLLREDCIVDLKTTEDASPRGFIKSIASFRYQIQAAHYKRILRLHGLPDLPFYFVCVEKEPPHAVAVYQLDTADLMLAEQNLLDSLRRLAACRDFNAWPAYSRGIETITLPKWANNQTQN